MFCKYLRRFVLWLGIVAIAVLAIPFAVLFLLISVAWKTMNCIVDSIAGKGEERNA